MPTFGNTGEPDLNRVYIRDKVIACKFQMESTGGTGDSISAYILDDGGLSGGGKIKCALYDSSLDLVDNSMTEEEDLDQSESLKWYTMNFNPSSKPTLVADAWYYIAVWSDDTPSVVQLSYDTGNGSGIISDNQTYSAGDYTGFPDPHANDDTVDSDANASIYCTYTESSEDETIHISTIGNGKMSTYGLGKLYIK